MSEYSGEISIIQPKILCRIIEVFRIIQVSDYGSSTVHSNVKLVMTEIHHIYLVKPTDYVNIYYSLRDFRLTMDYI